MKKTLAILLTFAVVILAVGNAAAAGFDFGFDDSPLMLTVYETAGTGDEITVALGNITSGASYTEGQSLAAAGTIDFASLGTVADLSVGLYGSDFFGDHNLVGSTAATAPTIRTSTLNQFNGYATNLAIAYGIEAAGTDVGTMAQSDNDSYSYNMGTSGRMGGFVTLDSQPDVAATLAVLDTVGYLDMYLYDFNAAGDADTYAAIIRINADGSVVANPAATVPVPGALVLLASGLVGLIGIRRKNA